MLLSPGIQAWHRISEHSGLRCVTWGHGSLFFLYCRMNSMSASPVRGETGVVHDAEALCPFFMLSRRL